MLLIPVLVNVAFITLLERKILGYRQSRLGPNKVSFIGILQPIADAIKLFLNQLEIPFRRNYLLFYFSPIFSVFFVLWVWSLIPIIRGFHIYSFSIILFLIILRFNVYPLLLAGWASNRKYALLGGLRGVAQTISYEIRLALILLRFLIFSFRFRIDRVNYRFKRVSVFSLAPFMLIIWIISCLAETNRTPFDFSEGESELVSGFNVEYGSGGFALIFIAEYASIYFLRIITVYMGLGWTPIRILRHVFSIFLVFFWVWARATLPRFRYDFLIRLAWKSILPLTLSYLEILLIRFII